MSAPFYSNVFFMCAARMAGQAIIVASYSYNTETELGAVKQVLEQPTINLSPGKHYSFNAGEVSWHIISGEIELSLSSGFDLILFFLFFLLFFLLRNKPLTCAI